MNDFEKAKQEAIKDIECIVVGNKSLPIEELKQIGIVLDSLLEIAVKEQMVACSKVMEPGEPSGRQPGMWVNRYTILNTPLITDKPNNETHKAKR